MATSRKPHRIADEGRDAMRAGLSMADVPYQTPAARDEWRRGWQMQAAMETLKAPAEKRRKEDVA